MKTRHAAVWVMGSQYISFVIQFVTSIYLARTYIQPDALGTYSIAFAAAAAVAVFQDFGLNRYIIAQQSLDESIIRTACTLSFVVSVGIAGAILVLAWPISWVYGNPELFPLLLILGCSYLLVPFATIPVALRQRAMDFRSMSMIEVGSIFVGSSISVILASLGLGAMALAWGVLGQQFTRGVIAQLRNGFLLPWPFNLKCVKPILYFGRGNSLLNLNGAISQRTPELIIGSFLSVTAVGLYSRAIGLVIQLRALASGAVASAFYPAFARVHGSGAPLGDPYIRVVAAYSAVSWPALTALAVAAEPLVLLLYGERWLGTVTLVKWLALSELCLVSLPLHVELPMLLGHFRLLLICNYIETIVAVGLLFLASTMGLEWVAISRLAYSLIWYVIYFPFLYNIIKFDLIALLGVYFRSMIATIAAVIPLLLSYHFWRTPDELGFSGLLACTVAGIVCWALTLFIFRHPTGSEILALLNDLMIKYSK